MDAELRARYNEAWSPSFFSRFRRDLDRRVGRRIEFPVAESPLFLPPKTWTRVSTAAREIMALLSKPEFIASRERDVPDRYRVPRTDVLPQFACIDFAIMQEDDGSLGVRCIELQGCPSLYAFQTLIADCWATHLALLPGMPDTWRLFHGDYNRSRATALMSRALLGNHDPDEVVLLDWKPDEQKTYPDFAMTRHWFGVDPVCFTELKIDRDKLFRVKDGKTIPIQRIYHRTIYDEVEAAGVELPFDLRHPFDVEWAPNPSWFFLWSKNALLHLDHPAIPKTTLLSALEEIPADLARHVLKPLYSFAGAGVNVDPTRADVEAILESERDRWVLQERVEYFPGLESVDGDKIKAEIRMMFVRPDDEEEMTLLLNLVRFSRGKMMGVNYNKDLSWTGASVAIWPF